MSAQPEAPEPEFSTVEEADRAYYGDSYNPDDSNDEDGNDGQDGNDGTRWGELQTASTDWVRGWMLVYQQAVNDGGLRRWFVIRTHPDTDQFQALTMTGQANDYGTDQSLEELPHTNAESEAREAYQTWVDENDPENGGDDGDDSDESSEWGKWQQVTTAGDWTIWARQHQSEDRAQFLAASTLDDGTPVYLQPDGSVGDEAHTYDSQQALQEAISAYSSRKERGEIPEGRRPTGNSPSRSEINRSTNVKRSGGPLKSAVEAVGGPTNAVLVGGIVLAGAYYAEREGHIDITEQIP